MKRLSLTIAGLLALSGCQIIDTERTSEVPAPTLAASAPPVSLHLSTFRQPYQEEDEWRRITRDFPIVGQYPPRLVAVPDIAFTRLYELFVDGVPGEQAASLCADMVAHDSYCAIALQQVPPAAATIPAPGTTVILPGSAPTIVVTPAVPPEKAP